MRVLIIDDEDIVRMSLRRAFQSKGHEVFDAADGVTGLEQIGICHPDIVFVDVLMPKLSGPNLLKEIPAAKNYKIILISAHTGEYNFTTAQNLGADLFISKPFENIFDVVRIAEELVRG